MSSGNAANGAAVFTFSGVLVDDAGISYPNTISNVVTLSSANGGADIESIDKIKFNAPKLYPPKQSGDCGRLWCNH